MNIKCYTSVRNSVLIGVIAALFVTVLALRARGYVWFGYSAARSQWFMTPTTITLEYPQQETQLQVVEYMPDICTTGAAATASCAFWTDNPEWTLTSNGLLSCRVSGSGVVYARVPTGTVISNTISVDPHLPARILQLPILPPTPAPSSNIYIIDLELNYLMYALGHGSYFDNNVFPNLTWQQRVQMILDKRTRQLTALGLQGLVNRRQPRIYIKDNQESAATSTNVGWDGYLPSFADDVLPYLTSRYNYTFVTTDLFWLIQHYLAEPQITGFLLYPQLLHMDGQRGDLINYITTYCGVHGTIPITCELYALLTNAYPACTNVVLNMSDQWIADQGLTNSAAIYARMLDELAPHCSRRAMMKLHPHIWQYNRDYAIAHKLFCFNYSTPYTGADFYLVPMTAAESNTYARLDALLSNQYVHGAVLGEWQCNFFPWINWYYAACDVIVSTTGGTREVRHIGGVTTNLFRRVPQYSRFAAVSEPILAANETLASSHYLFLSNGPPIIDSTRGYHYAETENFNIVRFSGYGLSVQYTFYGQNLSFHAGVPASLPFTRAPLPPVRYDPSKIYVTFYAEGSDSVSYKQPCPFTRWFSCTNAGVGLPMNSLNAELAPALMRYYVEQAPPTVEFAYGGPGNIENQNRDGSSFYCSYRAGAEQLWSLAREFAALGMPYATDCRYRFGNPYMNNQKRGAAVLSSVSTNWPLIIPGWLAIAGVDQTCNEGQHFGWQDGYGNINAGKYWWTNGVPVILPIQTMELWNNQDPSISNTLQIYSIFQDGLIQRGTTTYCRINEFCAGTLDWSATNRPQFWLINLSCAYVYARMYETNFYDAVWTSKLGDNEPGGWLSTHAVVPVTPSQFGQLMRDAKAAGSIP